MLQYHRLRATERGDVLVLELFDGRLSADLADEIEEELDAAAAQEKFKKILLDLSALSFVCSSLIGMLVALNKRLRGKGGALKLCGICPDIRAILAITKFDAILDIAESDTDALLAFA